MEMEQLIDAGYIYIAQPPLFRVAKGKEEYYAHDEAERDEYVKRLANLEVEPRRKFIEEHAKFVRNLDL